MNKSILFFMVTVFTLSDQSSTDGPKRPTRKSWEEEEEEEVEVVVVVERGRGGVDQSREVIPLPGWVGVSNCVCFFRSLVSSLPLLLLNVFVVLSLSSPFSPFLSISLTS